MSDNLIGKQYGNYILEKYLGAGSFGEVYMGKHIKKEKEVAIKIPKMLPQKNCEKTLIEEYNVYKDLHKNTDKDEYDKNGISNVHIVCNDNNKKVMVMNLLGKSLESLMTDHKRFGLRTVLIISIQMLRSIKYIHDRGYIHRDIKPDNFVLDYKNSKKIYCIDFGMAKKIKETQTSGYKFCGTARYASITAHNGITQSKKDDLEAIGYLFVYFFKGKLPWQIIKNKDKLEKYRLIGQLKESLSTADLCKNMPKEFLVYMNYVKSLDFEETPNYNSLINMFIKLYQSKNYEKETLEWEK
jgi:serine/threonine protein kinase